MEALHLAGDDLPAWFLDTDYNGLCFHVSQAFFPRTKAWDSIKRAVGADFEPWEKRRGRRKSLVFQPNEQQVEWDLGDGTLSQSIDYGGGYELVLVNRIRERVKQWRKQDYTGLTRTTLDLLKHWRREGRREPLFFAKLEAAETIIFLVEAPLDLRQGDCCSARPGTRRNRF